MRNDWEVIESAKGFSVYHNGRIVRYDCFDQDDALRLIRKKAPKGTKVVLVDADDNESKVTL